MVFGSAFRPPNVGLDIGTSALKAVVLRKGRGSNWSLVAAGEAPIPEHSQEGTPADPTAVSVAINELLDSRTSSCSWLRERTAGTPRPS